MSLRGIFLRAYEETYRIALLVPLYRMSRAIIGAQGPGAGKGPGREARAAAARSGARLRSPWARRVRGALWAGKQVGAGASIRSVGC